jgi:hypothetical protein
MGMQIHKVYLIRAKGKEPPDLDLEKVRLTPALMDRKTGIWNHEDEGQTYLVHSRHAYRAHSEPFKP